MGLILLEGFDTYATGNYTGKWSFMAGTIGAWGREGTNGLKHTTSSFMKRSVSNKQTIITGCGMKLSTTKSWDLIQFFDGGTIQMKIVTDGSNQVIVKRNNTTLLSTGFNLPTNEWFYLEFKATISNGSGSFEVRVNSNSIGSQSGIDTQDTGNAYINAVQWSMFGIGSSTHYLDDIYIFDDSGSFCNDFVGDVHVEAVFPDDAGYATQWAGFPVDGDANWEKVDESDPDSDTSFVATSGIGNIDSYDFGDLVTTSGSIFCLQVNAWAKKDDVGSRTLNAIARPTVTTYSGDAPVSLGNTYGYSTFVFEQNPQTDGFWTIAEINASEFGIKQEA